MNKIKLLADSTCDLSQKLIEELDVEIAPLMVTFDDEEESYLDGVNITIDDIEKKVEEKNILPKTNARSPEYHQELFEKYINEGYDVIYVCISSAISSTFNSALIAKSECIEPKRVQVIDSRNLCNSQAILLMKIRELINEGKTAREIRDICEKEIVPKLDSRFILQTAAYMAKGGRCSSFKAIMSRVLQMKPTLNVIDGKIELVKSPIGPMALAVINSISSIISAPVEYDDSVIFLTHFHNDRMIALAYEKLSALKYFKRIEILPCGTVIGSHCGPGTIGIFALKK